MVRPTHGELVHRPPFVLRRVSPVHQPNEVAARLAVFLVLHRHARHQQTVELPVGRQQHRRAQLQHLLERVVARRIRHAGIQPVDGRTQALRQHHLPVTRTFRCRAIVRDVGAVAVGVAHVVQPSQCFLFELVFGHRVPPALPCKMGASAWLM